MAREERESRSINSRASPVDSGAEFNLLSEFYPTQMMLIENLILLGIK